MKLIIDVEKDYYEMLKYNVEHGQEYKPFEIIANGTPYNPSGDAISREALKKDIEENSIVLQGVQAIEVACAKVLIDNAPTVEPERPQGEWIPMSTDSRGYSESFKCSICGAYIYPRCLVKELDYNGCPYCGAAMRTEDK